MRVAILHNLPAGDRPDEADTLVQVRAVRKALFDLGHDPMGVAFSLDLDDARGTLAAMRPDCVFNLVEDVGGSSRLAHLAPALLEHMGLAFTGCGSESMLLSTGKLACKRVLTAAALPTPPWSEGPSGGSEGRFEESDFVPGRYILKSVHEHASLGLDETSVVKASSPADLIKPLARRRERFGGRWFAEGYVEGREFNIAVVEGPSGPEVMPHAEIVFRGFSTERLRIVGYKAKWDEDSFEYENTQRRLDFPAKDTPLLARLTETSLACWRAFGLAGYARVDYRVSEDGTPWIIDVNANPCLSPDAGLVAAAGKAGLDYTALVRRILETGAGRVVNGRPKSASGCSPA